MRRKHNNTSLVFDEDTAREKLLRVLIGKRDVRDIREWDADRLNKLVDALDALNKNISWFDKARKSDESLFKGFAKNEVDQKTVESIEIVRLSSKHDAQLAIKESQKAFIDVFRETFPIISVKKLPRTEVNFLNEDMEAAKLVQELLSAMEPKKHLRF